ncbi:MAG TPA: SUMF1/EgtB/PvdO family nonheme iron enzyme, partial [Candidatus Udaeobacter sp.]|nr:SUMF1/EgtB/PvdO family nonheme iron enzyme [Candidatus Udaeobacter sp.]
MRDFRARTLDLVADLDDQQMIGPRLATVNPPLWEIGHIAWFQEFWVLRHLRKQKPLIENGDRLYNSTDVAHDTRWELLLPPRDACLRYMEAVLCHAVDALDSTRHLSPEESYFYLLAAFHEGMHAEALAYTRQNLGYPAPRFRDLETTTAADFQPDSSSLGDVEIPGGNFLIGATPDFPFVFDNEKWAHSVEIKPFRIARAPVTNGDFLAFIEAGGYRKPQFWSDDGWRWLASGGAPQLESSFAKFFNTSPGRNLDRVHQEGKRDHPTYWHREANGRWCHHVFDQYVMLNEHFPVVHVSWYEAEAYCNWSGRRLPTEAEWEVAASAEPSDHSRGLSERRRYFPWGNDPSTSERANLDWRNLGPVSVSAYPAGDSAFGCRQMIGNVWEWTADHFAPYPGFIVDPYKEYSKPW